MDITAPATPLAQLFDGHHSQVRSNMEPILCAMKPPDGTWAENAAQWDCGAFNVEAGRVPTVDVEDERRFAENHASVEGILGGRSRLTGGDRDHERTNGHSPAGRFPSLPLIEHAVDCEPGACVPGCPAAVLAEQSGELSPGGKGFSLREPKVAQATTDPRSGHGRGPGWNHRKGDAAAADRFFFQARPSRGERSAGCEGLFWQRAEGHPDGWCIVDRERFDLLPKSHRFEGNPHCALKSLELTRYLARLLRQPGEARLIVPFSGSGSEATGAMLGGWRHVVAIEGSAQCIVTAKRREAFWRRILDSGAEGSVRDLLGEHGPKKEKAADDRQGDLF